ncbi:MAG: hypothetical protein WBK55_08210 [Alphaproteobacteria bacterium]
MKSFKFLALAAALVFLAASTVSAQNVLNYKEQGGARHVIGGALDVVSGGEIDVESGAALKIAGTDVTAEIAAINNSTASGAELNYLDITALGTGAASKALVLDASGDYTFPAAATIVMPSGGTTTYASGSTLAVAGTFTNGGVAVPVIRSATDAVVSGQTSKTVTVTGATAASKCVATANEVATNAVYIRAAVPGTNQVVVTVSADPGASNLDLTVICLD